MSASSSLLGKRVLIPRGKQHAKPVAELVRDLGGIPVEIPLISFKPTITQKEAARLNETLHTYDWLIFTSNVTVETFFAHVDIKSELLPKIAVIGEKTKEVLEAKGLNVDFVPSQYVAEGFIEEFLPQIQKGEHILIPKGNLARDAIASALRQKEVIVKEIIVYKTHMPEDSKALLKEKLLNHQLDIILFTSPSTVDHFMEVVLENDLADQIKQCIIACIGPVSKDRAETHGLHVHAIPDRYTVKDMLNQIILYLKEIQTT
ncbi:uroporphyrinogen-III synthase [Bacillus mesophilum]|uniref:Uroporphyrinogen-III synthase n=1 Tax=Bacillus mesophilum TaxID=1071718 RepID=A0A7V7UWN3_9BACI|nr:uroporphyrinogen-III synthase [Bacillus mesophilum]KAB2334104.1 uroporphyrinogen-III synthase [Bacillus mesophilum]